VVEIIEAPGALHRRARVGGATLVGRVAGIERDRFQDRGPRGESPDAGESVYQDRTSEPELEPGGQPERQLVRTMDQPRLVEDERGTRQGTDQARAQQQG